tara:strand:- start:841 stop:1095 length:255 start_codon:yes stop_codon:yes gene_type:complete
MKTPNNLINITDVPGAPGRSKQRRTINYGDINDIPKFPDMDQELGPPEQSTDLPLSVVNWFLQFNSGERKEVLNKLESLLSDKD